LRSAAAASQIKNPKSQGNLKRPNPKGWQGCFFGILDFEVCLEPGICDLEIPRSGRPTIGTVKSHYRSFSFRSRFLFRLANNWFAAA
jgi:hypothetical protein